jgi:RHS repeat-associated protein
VTPSTRTNYIYAGENAIFETNTNLAKNTIQTTNRVYGSGTDDLLAYETDDTTLASSETPEYVFCLARVLPYTADFERYGWNSLSSRCNTLGNSYNTTERKIFFVQKDHLGSTIALTDSTGNIVQSYAYDVYGTPYIATGTGFTALRDFVGNLHGNDRFYTGREYEVSTGLYYYRARFYSPELGRFISRDPIGMSDDVNLYAYVGNSPMMGVDPDGRMVKRMVKIMEVGIKYAWESSGLNKDIPAFIELNKDAWAFLGLNTIAVWWRIIGLKNSSYMLANFIYWNWEKEYYSNQDIISKELKQTPFYKEKINELKKKIDNPDVYNDLLSGKIVSIPWHWTVSTSNFEDYGLSFWTIDWTTSASMDNDWIIHSNLNIKDSYIYNDKYADGVTPIENPANILAKYYQDRWYWKPFNWELDINDILN